MRAEISKDDCTGCGLCPSICPDVFEMGDEDVAVVRTDPVPDNLKEEVTDAAEQCPTEAIKVSE